MDVIFRMKASRSIITNCELQTHQGEFHHVVEEGDHVLSNEILHAGYKMLGLPLLFPHVHEIVSHLNSS